MVHTDLAPPVIHVQPRPVAVSAGQRANFSVEVESESRVLYRWRRNSVELNDGGGIVGSHTKWLRIRGIARSSDGDYDCVITNDAGSVFTAPARLTIGSISPPRPSDRSTPPAGAVTGSR